jgi:DNA replication protein DnaC
MVTGETAQKTKACGVCKRVIEVGAGHEISSQHEESTGFFYVRPVFVCSLFCEEKQHRIFNEEMNIQSAIRDSHGLLTEATFAPSRMPRMMEKECAAAIAQAREWNGKSNVYIHGKIGCGKTHLARRLLCHARRSIKGVFSIGEISAYDFTRAIFDKKSAMLDVTKSVHVLLIDDMDKAPWNEFTLCELKGVLDKRSDKKLPTILTSNWNASGIINDFLLPRCPENHSLVHSIFDRLKPVVKIHVSGESLR